MFPGPGAQVYYNDAGEPLGWDYPSDPDPADAYDDRDADYPEVEPFRCKCGDEVWPDDEDAIVAHYEICPEPDFFRSHFADTLADCE